MAMTRSISLEIEVTDLTGRLIVAMPGLRDPNFYHAVTYICAHNEHGAIGLVVNRPTNMDLADVFKQMKIHPDSQRAAQQRVYVGGPVQQDRGFVLHAPSKHWNSSIQITEQICVTTSRDIMQSLAHGHGPDEALVTLGYSGWATGQLEEEIAENTWLCVPCSPDLLFATPAEKRWAASLEMLGFDATNLSLQCGQA